MKGKKCEVSASEMMEMRREGLSNKDIAELLEISEPTVYKYIGKQGRRMERLAVFADKGKKKQPEATEEIRETKKQMTKPKYVPCSEVYSLGSGLTVMVTTEAKRIRVTCDGQQVMLTYDQAAALVEFLAWAGRERCQAEVDDAADDND
jgi:transposase